MSVSRAKVGAVLAAMAAVAVVAGAPGIARAENLLDLLWGGEPEYGGGRTVLRFSSEYKPGQIIVSFGDRRLYLITKAGEAISYPIAIPREQSRWEGVTTVSNKRINPDWRPTPDMMKENPKLPSWVPGGHPMNPLGVRALYLGSSTYRIHGTDAPWTIGQNVSKGCIRMFNEDVLDLYPRVPVGTKVIVTWDQFKTGEALTADASTARIPAPPGAADPRDPAQAGQQQAAASAPASGSASASADAAETRAPEKKSAGLFGKPPKQGFFIYPDDDANPPRPEEGMVTYSFGRKVGGTVSKAAQTKVE
jgi:lipoprotein-anchoring transpeptidase ErfK/SrfK